jgi:predicted metal-dependent hydrolase
MLAQTDAVNFPYTVSHRNVKHPRFEFRTGTLLVVLPKGHNENRLLEKHQRWIQRKYQFIQEALDTSATISLEPRTKEEFKKQVEELIRVNSQELGRAPDRVIFRKMYSKWASCSKNGNLTINSLGQYLPDDLVDYIVYHEMVHLINPNHDPLFWKSIHTKFKDTSEIEKSLCSYWFQVQRIG